RDEPQRSQRKTRTQRNARNAAFSLLVSLLCDLFVLRVLCGREFALMTYRGGAGVYAADDMRLSIPALSPARSSSAMSRSALTGTLPSSCTSIAAASDPRNAAA